MKTLNVDSFISYNQPCRHFSIDLVKMLIFFVHQWNSWPKNHTAASFLFCMTVWEEKPIMFVFQKRRETFQQDEIPRTLPLSDLTTKPSELSSAPANARNKLLTTPLKAGTQNKAPTSMTTNTTKWKSRLSTQLTSYFQEMNLNHENQLDVEILSLKQLNLPDALDFLKKPTKASQKHTSLATRKRVWVFWHQSCTYSIIIPARQKVYSSRSRFYWHCNNNLSEK